MAKKVTLADIAAEIGVSSVAVYKALSDKPGVSHELRVKIKTLAEQMGYQGTSEKRKEGEAVAGAEKKSGSMTGNIGVIIPEQYYGFSISFYGQLYEMVVKNLYKQNYFGILELLSAENERQGVLPRVLQGNKVDGLIFVGQLREEYVKVILEQAGVPVFFLDTYHPSMTFDTVISDGYYGTYMLTHYLIREGHRRIFFVGSVDATSSIADRYWGYRRALREAHLDYFDSMEIADRDEFGRSYENVIQSPVSADAFVCNSDWTAQIVLRNLEEQGIRVPEDVSVTGFDDFLPLGMEENRITSYKVDMERMAYRCVKSLLKKVQGRRYSEGTQIVTGRIVYRDTVQTRK